MVWLVLHFQFERVIWTNQIPAWCVMEKRHWQSFKEVPIYILSAQLNYWKIGTFAAEIEIVSCTFIKTINFSLPKVYLYEFPNGVFTLCILKLKLASLTVMSNGCGANVQVKTVGTTYLRNRWNRNYQAKLNIDLFIFLSMSGLLFLPSIIQLQRGIY